MSTWVRARSLTWIWAKRSPVTLPRTCLTQVSSIKCHLLIHLLITKCVQPIYFNHRKLAPNMSTNTYTHLRKRAVANTKTPSHTKKLLLTNCSIYVGGCDTSHLNHLSAKKKFRVHFVVLLFHAADRKGSDAWHLYCLSRKKCILKPPIKSEISTLISLIKWSSKPGKKIVSDFLFVFIVIQTDVFFSHLNKRLSRQRWTASGRRHSSFPIRAKIKDTLEFIWMIVGWSPTPLLEPEIPGKFYG